MKYECPCGYVYDPAVGDPENGIAPGTPFEEIPEDWVCPDCGLDKSAFDGGLTGDGIQGERRALPLQARHARGY